jgi:hypothetical protein
MVPLAEPEPEPLLPLAPLAPDVDPLVMPAEAPLVVPEVAPLPAPEAEPLALVPLPPLPVLPEPSSGTLPGAGPVEQPTAQRTALEVRNALRLEVIARSSSEIPSPKTYHAAAASGLGGRPELRVY